jgi:hypothetical protein
MLRAIQLVHRRLRGPQGGLIACIHDELLIEVAEKDAETVRSILEETMIEAFAKTFPGAPLDGVAQASKSGGTGWKPRVKIVGNHHSKTPFARNIS